MQESTALLERYGRQILLDGVGLDGQRRLQRSSVLLVGTGGLGSPAALYLAAAGVGTIGLVDDDRVELSNLQRQVLFEEKDVGRPKVTAAAECLERRDSGTTVVRHPARLDAANAEDLIRDYDVVLDGSDNFPTRYAINDACLALAKPWVHASVLRFEGQLTVFTGRGGPCYRCLFPSPPPRGAVPSCGEAGVLGAVPGLMGTWQATEVLKLLLGIGEPLVGRLVTVDLLYGETYVVRTHGRETCEACGRGGRERTVEKLPPPDIGPAAIPEIEPSLLAEKLRRGGIQLVDVREPYEQAFGVIDGARSIPLGELEVRLGELNPHVETVVYCHLGVRSLTGAQILREAGFREVAHLRGGIDAWRRDVDPRLPRY